MRPAPLLLVFVLSSALAGAEDLTTRDGKVYHGYKVLSHDAGFITIMYSDGGGKIPLSQLPDDLQKLYGYDKAASDAAVQAAVAQERRDLQAVADEERQRQKQVSANVAATDAPSPPTANNSGEVAAAPATDATPKAVTPEATSSAVASTPSAAASDPASPAQAPLTQDEIDALEGQIGDLMTDVASMQAQSQKAAIDNRTTSFEPQSTPHPATPSTSSNPYLDKIAAEKAQMTALRKKLMDDNKLIGKSVPFLTQDAIDADYARIAEVRKDAADAASDNAGQAMQVPIKASVDQIEVARLEDRLDTNFRLRPRAPLPPDQIDAMNAQIADLTKDMDQLKADRAIGTTHGAYDDKIVDDEVKIEQLKAELNAQ